jgi:cysteine synthase
VGLALIGVNRGYAVKLFVPEGFAEEKCILMRGFGAEVFARLRTKAWPARSSGRARRERRFPGSFTALQFQNQANPQFHHDTTAVEIWEQMEGRVDGFVAGVGTGGTFSGVARFLKEQNPAVVNVAVETEGRFCKAARRASTRSRASACSFVPETFHRDVCDRIVAVTDEDAFGMVKRLAAEEGLVGGSSSGAAVFAAVELARELGAGKRIAVIIPDSAERYLSKKIFEGGG